MTTYINFETKFSRVYHKTKRNEEFLFNYVYLVIKNLFCTYIYIFTIKNIFAIIMGGGESPRFEQPLTKKLKFNK